MKWDIDELPEGYPKNPSLAEEWKWMLRHRWWMFVGMALCVAATIWGT